MAELKLGGITIKLDDSVGAVIAEQSRGDKRLASSMIRNLVDELRQELIADTKTAMEFFAAEDLDQDEDVDIFADVDDFDLEADEDLEFDADLDDLLAELELEAQDDDEDEDEEDEDEEDEDDEDEDEDDEDDEEVEGVSQMGRRMKKRRRAKDPIVKYLGCKKPTMGRGRKGGRRCKYTCWGKSRKGRIHSLNISMPKGKGRCMPLKQLKGKPVKTLNKPPRG